MSDYVYILKAIRPEMLSLGPTPEEEAVLAEHAAYLRRLGERGDMLLFGRTRNDDATAFGLVVFEAGSEEAAREIMAGDPAVREGVMRAELYPYRVAFRRRD